MSNIDPFGNSSTYNGGYNRRMKSAPGDARSGNGLMNGLGQLGGLAQDMGQQFGKKGAFKGLKRGWTQIGIYLAVANLLYGLGVVAWSFTTMRNHLSGGFAFILGALARQCTIVIARCRYRSGLSVIFQVACGCARHREKASACQLAASALRRSCGDCVASQVQRV